MVELCFSCGVLWLSCGAMLELWCYGLVMVDL